MKKGIFVLSVMSALLAFGLIASSAMASHEHPIGASPIRVPLVPAFDACTSPNSTHGPPLAFPSCNPPVPTSGLVKTGAGSIGSGWIIVCNVGSAVSECNQTAPGFTSAMQPDVRLYGAGRDVQCRITSAGGGCSAPGADYNPNGSGPYTTTCTTATVCGDNGKPTPFCAPGAGSSAACAAGSEVTETAALGNASGTTVDPTAQCGTNPACLAFAGHFVGHAIRVTDHYNCGAGLPPTDANACPADPGTSNRAATMVDILFPVPVDCLPTASAALGSTCGANTTANALVPDSVIAGKQAIVETGEIEALESGSDAIRGNSNDEVFATQGIYLP